uniref:Uncharacterized protein n=1 Tax=Arundo donax TaxID=35708 RepID=A0A0A9CG47_ARUDO
MGTAGLVPTTRSRRCSRASLLSGELPAPLSSLSIALRPAAVVYLRLPPAMARCRAPK